MEFKKGQNFARVEGILSEIDLKYNSYVKNGVTVESIGGMVKVLVETEVDGTMTALEVPLYQFSTKYKKDGNINPAYTAIEKVMNEFSSIASCGSKEQADKVRANGVIKMNEFPGQNGKIVSQPRVQANFISRVVGDFNPEAKFELEFMVSKIARAVDKEGVEIDPARLNIEVIVPQYTSPSETTMNVDLVKLNAYAPNVVNAIENYWEAGSCYKAAGRLNFSSRTEEVVEELGFGEAQKRTRTVNVNELIVTGGSEVPLEGDFAFDFDQIKAGMAARAQRLEDLKSGKVSKAKQTPAQDSSKGKFNLGF